MSEQAANIEKGYLVAPDDEADENKRIKLHFNPNSLSYTVEASAQQGNQPNRTGQVQYAAQYSARLSLDTFFDNTDTGEDVRLTTDRIAQMLQPAPAAGGGGASHTNGVAAPPLVVFHWGAFRFTGVLTQYKETIEFFAKEGVPLRSAVSLTLLKQDKTLERDASAKANTGGALVPTSGSDSALSAATRGGDPRAARGLASANGLESLRFTGGATLQVGGAFQASAGVSSASSSFSASSKWDASGSGGLFSAKASAGVSASAGAFAGVGASAGVSTSLDSSRMLSTTVGADVSTHASASFSLGGAAQSEAGAGLTADVGARASWKDLVRFHDDEG